MRITTKLGLMSLAIAMVACSGEDSGGSGNCNSDIAFIQPGRFADYSMSTFGFNSGHMTLTFGECNGSGFAMDRKIYDISNNLSSQQIDRVYEQDGYMWIKSGANLAREYKVNAQLGDEWQDELPDGRIVYHKVIDMDSIVTVPAGTFHCKVYTYHSSTADTESRIFWNDEVGQVMEDADGFFVMKLLSYE